MTGLLFQNGIMLKHYPNGLLETMQRVEHPNWLKTLVALRVILKRYRPQFARALRHASLNVELSQSEGVPLPKISVLMTVHPKDNMRVGFAIDTLKKYSKNTIDEFTLVTTDDNIDFLTNFFAEDLRIRILSEEKSAVWNMIEVLREIGGARYGHILQQMLKLWHCIESKSDFVLVFDSDTFLTRPTAWVNSESVSGIFPTFHSSNADNKLVELYPDFVKWNQGECYISHHLVFNRKILKAFLLELGQYANETVTKMATKVDLADIEQPEMFFGLINYARLGHDMSEYDSYSKYAIHNYPTEVQELRWSNMTLFMEDFEIIKEYLSKEGNSPSDKFIKKFRSISVHDHR